MALLTLRANLESPPLNHRHSSATLKLITKQVTPRQVKHGVNICDHTAFFQGERNSSRGHLPRGQRYTKGHVDCVPTACLWWATSGANHAACANRPSMRSGIWQVNRVTTPARCPQNLWHPGPSAQAPQKQHYCVDQHARVSRHLKPAATAASNAAGRSR